MRAPSEIIDLLQPLISIYFYDIQLKHRSVIILSDNVAEISCKLKILENNPGENVKKIDFPWLLERVKVPKKLNDKLSKYHELRNEFQHRSPFYTIEEKTCADSVIATLDLIKWLWKKNALKEIPDWVNCGLRVVKLFSSKGNIEKRNRLEKSILNDLDLYLDQKLIETNVLIDEDGILIKGDYTGSRIEKRLPRKSEAIIQVCVPKFWTYLFHNNTSAFEQYLVELKIDEL